MQALRGEEFVEKVQLIDVASPILYHLSLQFQKAATFLILLVFHRFAILLVHA
jgi:hypothetical protein